MRQLVIYPMMILACACSNNSATPNAGNNTDTDKAQATPAPAAGRHFEGRVTKGIKGTISFDVSADGRSMENVALKGHWYCDGKMESIVAGPDAGFPIVNQLVKDSIVEKDGNVAFRFYMDARLEAAKAAGTFKMTLHPGYCTTGDLEWSAEAK